MHFAVDKYFRATLMYELNSFPNFIHGWIFTARAEGRKRKHSNSWSFGENFRSSIVGEHEILFCGPDEVITLSHSAGSRRVFANGAVNAAVFLADKGPGLYTMKDLMKELL